MIVARAVVKQADGAVDARAKGRQPGGVDVMPRRVVQHAGAVPETAAEGVFLSQVEVVARLIYQHADAQEARAEGEAGIETDAGFIRFPRITEKRGVRHQVRLHALRVGLHQRGARLSARLQQRRQSLAVAVVPRAVNEHADTEQSRPRATDALRLVEIIAGVIHDHLQSANADPRFRLCVDVVVIAAQVEDGQRVHVGITVRLRAPDDDLPVRGVMDRNKSAGDAHRLRHAYFQRFLIEQVGAQPVKLARVQRAAQQRQRPAHRPRIHATGEGGVFAGFFLEEHFRRRRLICQRMEIPVQSRHAVERRGHGSFCERGDGIAGFEFVVRHEHHLHAVVGRALGLIHEPAAAAADPRDDEL
ncbi:MAG: hypothetical protein BWY76_02114 [bacterium ADurb.Bin429]|nr:MAG: hypothetical protein BWY76_02114 [bacterium ADurb.Bin429]